MNASRVHDLRRRLAAARADDSAEGGFVLIYVLIITMLVTTAVTAVVMTTTQAIVPTRDSVNRTTAYTAAQAGIQDAVAWINQKCPSVGTSCTGALGATGTSLRANGADVLASGSTSSLHPAFTWKIKSSTVQDLPSNPTYQYLRVTATGYAGGAWTTSGGTSTYKGGRAVALTADISGTPGILDYEYYSTYETNGSTDVGVLNPARTVYINCTSVQAAAGSLSVSCPTGTSTSASWNGAAGAVTAGNASAQYPSPSVCDKLWYDSSAFDGASGLGRASTQLTQTGLQLNPGADWEETGTANGTAVTRYVPCQVAFTQGQSFNSKAYTVDSPLISNGTPTGTGASFTGGLYTAWQPTSNPQAPATEYRSDPYVGGTLATNAIARANPLTLSNSFNPAVPSNACIFYGPTRVYLNGNGTATVTSPQTTTSLQTASGSPSTCYTSAGTGQFTVTYSSGSNNVIYVKNNGASSAFTTTGQRADSTASAADTSFWLTNNAITGTLDTASSGATDSCSSTSTYTGTTANAACAWSGASTPAGSGFKPDTNSGWTTYTNNTSNVNGCGSLQPTDRLLFECEFNGGSVAAGHPDYYSILRTRVKNDLATSSYTCGGSSFALTTATGAQLACLLNNELKVANTNSTFASSSPTGSGQHQYLVTNTATTTSTTTQTVANSTAPSAPISGDSFFTQQAGAPATESVTTTATTLTISRQASTCSLLNVLGICVGSWVWGDGTTVGASNAQFQVTITQKTYGNLTGTPAVSYFPSMQDVTQYGTGTGGANGSSGPGDVYLQGVNNQPLSVLSDGDAVITGNLTTTGSGSTLVDALGDVRIYNPMSCKDQTKTDLDATTPGFCPNDLTGLYTGGLVSGGTLSPSHPANQYVNMLGTPVSTIVAALLAQGSNNSTGSVRTDNANRGSSDGTLNLTGGLYQRHRGTLGVQWEYLSTATGSRASSGYKLAVTYNNLQNSGLGYVPVFTGGSTTRYWNVVATSTCPNQSCSS